MATAGSRSKTLLRPLLRRPKENDMNELSLLNTIFGNAMDDMNDYGFRTPYNVPNVDVKENKDSYTVEMDLPGRTEKDVDLELDHNVLTISSTKTEEKEDKKENKEEGKAKWLIKERRTSSFSRRFTLPEDVDAEHVQATFKNGVLNVNIPRKALAAPKKIAITA